MEKSLGRHFAKISMDGLCIAENEMSSFFKGANMGLMSRKSYKMDDIRFRGGLEAKL